MTSTLQFKLDPEYLDNLATKYHQQYIDAKPFPHIIIDDFLPEYVLNEILEEFPKPEQIKWQSFQTQNEKKLASTSELQMGDKTRLLLYQLNSSIFVNFLEKLTGIDGIIPDPHFIGGGLRFIYKNAHNAIIRLDYGIDLYNFNERGFVVGLGQYF